MKIKDVEEQTGIERASIRYYEREGLLVTRRNPANGYREYSEENVVCLEKIIFLRKLGITIEDIRRFQDGKVTIHNIMESRINHIANENENLKQQSQICELLLNEPETDFSALSILNYDRPQNNRSGSEILGNPASAFYAMKEAGLIWILIIISFLLAILSLLFLPERVPIEFIDNLVTNEASKWFMFLFPILGVLVAVFLKTMVLNMLYQREPMLSTYGEEIADYLGIWVVSVLCWYQILVIIFTSGYNFNFDLAWDGLNFAFLIVGAVLMFLRYNKHKGDHKWKY
ncbi:MAG: MerR family transcriptional regulator [Lachnospiraceae bacterium]